MNHSNNGRLVIVRGLVHCSETEGCVESVPLMVQFGLCDLSKTKLPWASSLRMERWGVN